MVKLSSAAPQRREWLTIYPLVGTGATDLGCALMAEAIRDGSLRITEVGEGTVPTLIAINDGELGVLVLDGEQFIGARQNRMAGRTILLPARSKTEIPVSCMEQGRWRSVGRTFEDAPYHSPSTVRRVHRILEERVTKAGLEAATRVLREAQGEVWSEIDRVARDYGSRSSTGALDEVTGARQRDVETWLAGFPRVEGQVGLLAFLGPHPLGLDAIGDPALYRRLHERLVAGYVQDALRSRGVEGEPEPEAAGRYLRQVERATRTGQPTVGLGEYRVLTGAVTGAELVDDDRLVHRSAFPTETTLGRERPEGGQPTDRPIPPPSHRRRPDRDPRERLDGEEES